MPEIKTIGMMTEFWETVTTENAFRISGNVSVLSWIIKLGLRVTSSIKTFLMDLQYF